MSRLLRILGFLLLILGLLGPGEWKNIKCSMDSPSARVASAPCQNASTEIHDMTFADRSQWQIGKSLPL
jgi:hypothetical protein